MDTASLHIQQLLTALYDRPIPAKLLRHVLGGISPATLSRLTRRAADRIVVLGQTRATTYARPRTVRGLGHRFPVYSVDPSSNGDIHARGDLVCLYGAYWWEGDNDVWPSHLYTHLPWFIQDMRPEGFVGRALTQRFHTELGLPDRLSAWHDDDLLVFLTRRGHDVTGNLIIGDEALDRHLQSLRKDIPASQAEYPRLADEALAGDPAGSSAGGEQPKFSVLADFNGELRHLLVKFSPLIATPHGQRWSDLLVCEHIALGILSSRLGIASAHTSIVQTAERTYLEVQRFDRVGKYGRSAMHSLTAVDAEFLGLGSSNWTMAGKALMNQKLISVEDANELAMLDAFGNLIANTDRHFGNISLIPNDSRDRFKLAPAYDMLPMYYRPKDGELPCIDAYSPSPVMDCGQDALMYAAEEFWKAAAGDSRISGQFREICLQNAAAVMRLGEGPRIFRKMI
jgi:hypothetical protein